MLNEERQPDGFLFVQKTTKEEDPNVNEDHLVLKYGIIFRKAVGDVYYIADHVSKFH